jgi:hypothetical protein
MFLEIKVWQVRRADKLTAICEPLYTCLLNLAIAFDSLLEAFSL